MFKDHGINQSEISAKAKEIVNGAKSSDERVQRIVSATTAKGSPLNIHVLPSNHQIKGIFTTIRDRDTSPNDFVFMSDRIMRMLVQEAINLLPSESITIETPTGQEYHGTSITKMCCAISIVRSGECMEEALRSVWRSIKVGKILIARDTTSSKPRLLYLSLPADVSERNVLLLDPMLGSGITAVHAIDALVSQGVNPEKIIFVSLIASPEGLLHMNTAYPQVTIVTGEVDEYVNEKGMIIPGVGNFGDRYFGTERK